MSGVYLSFNKLQKITQWLDDGTSADWYGKPLRGGAFGHGGFFLTFTINSDRGLPEVKYAVIHAESCSPISQFYGDKLSAINEARAIMDAVPSSALLDLLGPRTQEQKRRAEEYKIELASRIESEQIDGVRSISTKRKQIFDASGGVCFYCKATLEIKSGWHIEHKQPKSKGGSNDFENLVAACIPCNMKKGTKTAEEFLALAKQMGVK